MRDLSLSRQCAHPTRPEYKRTSSKGYRDTLIRTSEINICEHCPRPISKCTGNCKRLREGQACSSQQ